MKTLVRAFVLSLVVTGAVASTQTVSASGVKATIAPRNSAMPVPVCPPNDPNGCGIGAYGGH